MSLWPSPLPLPWLANSGGMSRSPGSSLDTLGLLPPQMPCSSCSLLGGSLSQYIGGSLLTPLTSSSLCLICQFGEPFSLYCLKFQSSFTLSFPFYIHYVILIMCCISISLILSKIYFFTDFSVHYWTGSVWVNHYNFVKHVSDLVRQVFYLLLFFYKLFLVVLSFMAA